MLVHSFEVYARNYAAGPKWLPGRVIKTLGNVMFNIRTKRGVWRRHHNQLQPRFEEIILNDHVPSHFDLNSASSPNHYNNNSNDQPSTSVVRQYLLIDVTHFVFVNLQTFIKHHNVCRCVCFVA